MKQPQLFFMALVLTAFSSSETFAQNSDTQPVYLTPMKATPTKSKKTRLKDVSKSKNKSTGDKTIIFPKVSKTDNSSDNWSSQSSEHSGRTRGGNSNRQTFR